MHIKWYVDGSRYLGRASTKVCDVLVPKMTCFKLEAMRCFRKHKAKTILYCFFKTRVESGAVRIKRNESEVLCTVTTEHKRVSSLDV